MFKCYLAFIQKAYFLFSALAVVGLLILAFLGLSVLDFYPMVLLVMLPILLIMISAMMDFFTFGGIAVKKQKLMEYVKSSIKGHEIVKNCVIADAIVAFAKMFFLCVGIIIIANVLGNELNLEIILLTISVAALSTALLFVGQLITRKFCQTLVMQMLITYLLSSFMSLSFIPVFMLLSTEGVVLLKVLVTLALIGLDILLGFLLVRMCVKGYDSGFIDN